MKREQEEEGELISKGKIITLSREREEKDDERKSVNGKKKMEKKIWE